MKKIFLLLILSAFTLEAATSYEVKEIKKTLNDQNQVVEILITVTVTIDGEKLDGATYLLPDARAAVLADSSKYKDYCEKLAAETEIRLAKIRSDRKEEKVDPATVTIDPAKVQEEKDRIENK